MAQRRQRIASGLSCLFILSASTALFAQAANYPSAPVKIITPILAGAGPDAVLRIVADRLGNVLQFVHFVETPSTILGRSH